MTLLLTALPLPVLGAVVIGIAILLSLAGLALVRRLVPVYLLEETNDVAGFIYAALTVMYGVLIAWVVVAVWEDYSVANAAVQQEAEVLGQLHRDARVYPGTIQQEIDERLRSYMHTVIDEEWPLLAYGKESVRASDQMDQLFGAYLKADTQTPREIAWHAEALKHLNEVATLRNNRVFQSKEALPGIIWTMLLLGTVTSIGYTYLFGVKNFVAHCVMTGSLAGTISFVLFLIVALDHPYTGTVTASPEPFQVVLEEMEERAGSVHLVTPSIAQGNR